MSVLNAVGSAFSYQSISSELNEFGRNVEDVLHATIEKIKELISTRVGQWIIGLALGAAMCLIYSPLTEKIVQLLGFSANMPDPFAETGMIESILLTPFVCVIGPAMEEWQFRGAMQSALNKLFESMYLDWRVTDKQADILARITSVFFTSVVFGLVHFTNALVFDCNPILFLPQVIAATIMGLLFGAAKELTGNLDLPTSMHIGNNTLAWANYMYLKI